MTEEKRTGDKDTEGTNEWLVIAVNFHSVIV